MIPMDSHLPYDPPPCCIDAIFARLALAAAPATLLASNLTDPTLTAGVTRVKAAHVSEIRSGVK